MASEVLKQFRIKSSVVTRLKKEYQSYDKEVTAMQTKINALPSGNEEADLVLKKQKEFLGESEMVLSNVKHKFVQAYEDLQQFYVEKSTVPEIDNSQEKAKASEVLADAKAFLSNIDV